MQNKSWRKERRIKRKYREAAKRIDNKVKERVIELSKDPKVLAEIDAEIEAKGGAKQFLEDMRRAQGSVS